MNNKLIFLFICLSINLCGQNINKIRKSVSKINVEVNYQIKIVNNDYFVENRNEITDNGQELIGFYKNNNLKKMTHEIGLSNKKIVIQYYFVEERLIFVLEKNYITIDENGYLKTPKLLSERRVYFQNQKIIKETNPDLINKVDYLKESEILKIDLLKN